MISMVTMGHWRIPSLKMSDAKRLLAVRLIPIKLRTTVERGVVGADLHVTHTSMSRNELIYEQHTTHSATLWRERTGDGI